MYPQPPVSHKPTNYYWILAICVGLMLVFLLVALRTMSGRLTAAAAEAPVTVPVPSQPLRALASPAAQPSPSAEASTAATPVVPADNGAAIDVDAKALTDAPAVYRSRLVRVRGTVFYSGKLADGKTWIQIVGDNNVYVDGQMSEPLPSGVSKGVEVQVTGIGAGLTSVTATNGKDYDQAFIDPIQKIEVVK